MIAIVENREPRHVALTKSRANLKGSHRCVRRTSSPAMPGQPLAHKGSAVDRDKHCGRLAIRVGSRMQLLVMSGLAVRTDWRLGYGFSGPTMQTRMRCDAAP